MFTNLDANWMTVVFISLLFCNVICDFPHHVCCTTLRQQRDCAEVYTNQHKPKKTYSFQPTEKNKLLSLPSVTNEWPSLQGSQVLLSVQVNHTAPFACHVIPKGYKTLFPAVTNKFKKKKRKKEKRRLLLYHAKKPQRGTEATAAATEKLNTHKN